MVGNKSNKHMNNTDLDFFVENFFNIQSRKVGWLHLVTLYGKFHLLIGLR